jgi:hypothetical protein
LTCEAAFARLATEKCLKAWIRVFALVLFGATIATGKSTKLITSWKNPEYSGSRFHRVLVLGMSTRPGVRADFEDALSKLVTRDGVEAIPGNTILLRPEDTKLDINYLKAQIKEFKIDAVIVSRLVKVETSVTYVPGQAYAMPYPYYRSFYGYYGAVYPVVYSPDYLREDTTVRVETNFYDTRTPDGEIVWTGTSDTFNPRSADKAIDGVSKLIVKELSKDGIL